MLEHFSRVSPVSETNRGLSLNPEAALVIDQQFSCKSRLSSTSVLSMLRHFEPKGCAGATDEQLAWAFAKSVRFMFGQLR